MFARLLNALMISGRSLLLIPVSLILYLQMHDVHFIDRQGTSVSASCGNLSIRSISGIQSYFAGDSAKWNDTCRVKSRHCLTFSSDIIAALMRFGQKNPYQSSWLVSGQSNEQEFQLKNIFGCIYLSTQYCREGKEFYHTVYRPCFKLILPAPHLSHLACLGHYRGDALLLNSQAQRVSML